MIARNLRYFTHTIITAVIALEAVFPALASGQVRVAVSIPPQRYFVERIGGDNITVTVMIPPGSEPHTYEPKPRQLTELAAADVYFTIGDTFEDAWLDRFRMVNPGMHIVDTAAHIDRIPMAVHGEDDHDPDHGHDHASGDPHIWLSPPLVKLQAKVIYETLATLDTEHAGAYADGYESFIREIDRLDSEIRSMFADAGELNSFMVFHPSWGYFAEAYGLEQIPVETEGREPTSAELMRLITFAKDKGITVVFVQPQFSVRSAGMLAREIGGSVITADPLAGDWSANLLSVARSFREAVR